MMSISTTVIPGHPRQAAQSAALSGVNPESRQKRRSARLDSGFKRFALAPE
jgi:hypothetical protein